LQGFFCADVVGVIVDEIVEVVGVGWGADCKCEGPVRVC